MYRLNSLLGIQQTDKLYKLRSGYAGAMLYEQIYIHTPTLTHSQPSQPASHACETVDSQLHWS